MPAQNFDTGSLERRESARRAHSPFAHAADPDTAHRRVDPHAERGLTMIEVLLATTASVIVVGALLTAMVQQSRQRLMITETSLATSAILNNLERARTLSDAEVASLDGVDFDVPGPQGAANGLQPVSGDIDGLPGELTVVVDRSAGGAVLYRVAAAVTWQGASGRRRMMLQTLLGERR